MKPKKLTYNGSSKVIQYIVTCVNWLLDNRKVENIEDVTITNLSDGQILKYDETNEKWINADDGGSVSTDTWRGINVNGSQLLGNGISSGNVNFKSGTNAQVSGSGNDITVDVSTAFSNSDVPSTRTNIASGDSIKTILGKIKKYFDDLKTVAFTNSYTDLDNKPTIPTVNNATLNIKKNGTSQGTFTANASTDVNIDISVPTKTSDLTNDSGYVNDISGKVSKTGDTMTGQLVIEYEAGSTTPQLLIKNTQSGGTKWGINHLVPNVTDNNFIVGLLVGKANSKNNSAWFGYIHVANGSSDNCVTIGMYGVDHILKLFADRRVRVNSGRFEVANWSDSSVNYTSASMQVREYNYGGSQTDNWTNAPRLAFHWSGRCATQIGLGSNGQLFVNPNSHNNDNFYQLVYNTGTWSINVTGSAGSVPWNGLTGMRSIHGDGSADFADYAWHKVATATITDSYQDRLAHWFVTTNQTDGAWASGILSARLRSKESGLYQALELAWQYKTISTYIPAENFVATFDNSTSTATLWCKIPERYSGYKFTLLENGYRLTVGQNGWTMLGSTYGHGDSNYSGDVTVQSIVMGLANTLPLTGGTMSGPLIVEATKAAGSYDEGIRINTAKNGYATLLLGGTGSTGTRDGAFWLGVWASDPRKLWIAHGASTSRGNTYFGAIQGQTSPYLNLGSSGSIASADTKAVTGGTVYDYLAVKKYKLTGVDFILRKQLNIVSITCRSVNVSQYGIPSSDGCRPSEDIYIPASIQSGSDYYMGLVKITSSGNMYMYTASYGTVPSGSLATFVTSYTID